MATSINIEELKQLLTDKDSILLLDVRRKSDYESNPNMIKGAVWRDPEQIEEWATQLPDNTRMVTYCVKGGSVSRSVTDRLCREGVDAVFLDGGIKTWIENGGTVLEYSE